MKVFYSINKNSEFPHESQEANELFDRVVLYTLRYKKYKTMWALRSLEEEFENHSGAVVITDSVDEPITIRGFPYDLTDRISELIKIEYSKDKF